MVVLVKVVVLSSYFLLLVQYNNIAVLYTCIVVVALAAVLPSFFLPPFGLRPGFFGDRPAFREPAFDRDSFGFFCLTTAGVSMLSCSVPEAQ